MVSGNCYMLLRLHDDVPNILIMHCGIIVTLIMFQDFNIIAAFLLHLGISVQDMC